MSTFRDYLKFYNTVDVLPFCFCIERMLEYYHDLNLDPFKDGLSVPGLVMRYLMGNLPNDTFFSLFDKKDEDVYRQLKRNLTGGPSIVFTRLAEAGSTKIRLNGEETCRSIQGFDSNALYLFCVVSPFNTDGEILSPQEGNRICTRTLVF